MAESYAEAAQIRAVRRAVDLLQALARHPQGASVTQLAGELGMPKSSVYRLLTTLRSAQWVSQLPHTERYVLGLGLVEVSAQALEAVSLRDLARPHLEALWQETGESIHLGILHDVSVVYVMKYESRHSIRMYSQVGRRAPLYCTGLGKAILAWLPPEKRTELLRQLSLVRYTPRTLVELDSLLQDLEETRRRGYAIDNAEHEDFVRCVAAPILGPDGVPVASISIAAPVFRMTEDKLPAWGAMVAEHCRQISAASAALLPGRADL
jgi:IclR family KDG regulon transcriptional repressor